MNVLKILSVMNKYVFPALVVVLGIILFFTLEDGCSTKKALKQALVEQKLDYQALLTDREQAEIACVHAIETERAVCGSQLRACNILRKMKEDADKKTEELTEDIDTLLKNIKERLGYPPDPPLPDQ